MNRDDFIAGIAADIEKKVVLISTDVGMYDLLRTRQALLDRNGGGAPTPCQVVLLQEIERWNRLAIKMAVTLSNLQKALTGEIGMSDELDTLGDDLYNAFLPSPWQKLAPATQKGLGSWMQHFQRRKDQYDLWIKEGEPARGRWHSQTSAPWRRPWPGSGRTAPGKNDGGHWTWVLLKR